MEKQEDWKQKECDNYQELLGIKAGNYLIHANHKRDQSHGQDCDLITFKEYDSKGNFLFRYEITDCTAMNVNATRTHYYEKYTPDNVKLEDAKL